MILTKAAFAERMGVDRAQPTRWAARGMPCLPDGRVDVEAAETWVARHIDRSQRRRRSIRARSARLPAPPSPAPFPCMDHLEHDCDRMAMVVLHSLAYRLPATLAVLAVHAGAAPEVARELLPAARIAIMGEAADVLTEAGVPPPPGFDSWADAPMWMPDRFAGVDWPQMDRVAAERVPGAPPMWRLYGAAAAGG